MSDEATPAKVRLTDGLGQLPEPHMTIVKADEHGFLRETPLFNAHDMRAYAAQERAAERERCAQFLDQMAKDYKEIGDSEAAGLCDFLASGIRA